MIAIKLKEMPYISIDHSSDKVFDLELENYKSSKEIINYLHDILTGKKFTDKYNNVIELKSDKDKKDFIKNLKDNYILKNIVRSKFTDNEKKLLDIILKGV